MQFIVALGDEKTVEIIKLIFESMFASLLSSVTAQLPHAVEVLSKTVEKLRQEDDAKDLGIRE